MPVRTLIFDMGSSSIDVISHLGSSEDPGIESGCHQRAELLALPQKIFPKLTAADQRLPDGAPAQARDDRFDTATRAGAIVTHTNVKGIGHRLGTFEARV